VARLIVLETVGNYPQGKGLHPGDGVVLGDAMGKYTRALDDLSNPAPVGLELELNCEDLRHRSTTQETATSILRSDARGTR